MIRLSVIKFLEGACYQLYSDINVYYAFCGQEIQYLFRSECLKKKKANNLDLFCRYLNKFDNFCVVIATYLHIQNEEHKCRYAQDKIF